MNWWEWLAVAWVATGLFVICAIELASRSAGDRGPLSQERILHSIGFCAALIVGALFVVLYSLGICCQMLWQGRVPITNRVWWSARAAKFSKSDGRPRRETVLVQMIELRRRKDPRLRNVSRPSNWPMFQLWEAPEATVLSAVENFGWLKDAGLTDQSALQRLNTNEHGALSGDPILTLNDFVKRKLRMVDAAYLALGDDLLAKQVDIADKWASDEIQWIKSERPFPPIEWLVTRTSIGALDGTDIRRHRDWRSIAARMTERDELWEFNSPPEYWEGLAGRMGIVLVRDGRPIAHIVTAMN